jgi:hypothetical protein
LFLYDSVNHQKIRLIIYSSSGGGGGGGGGIKLPLYRGTSTHCYDVEAEWTVKVYLRHFASNWFS